MTSEEFKNLRSLIGKSGFYRHYEVRSNGVDETFAYFHEDAKPNYFLNDLVVALGKKKDWRGPAFEEFQDALSDEKSARWAHIITGRGHSPQSMRVGLAFLQLKGFIRYLVGVENIFPVSYSGIEQEAGGTSATKARVMNELLDQLESVPLSPEMVKLVDSEGTGQTVGHVWEYSDDDPANIKKAIEVLSEKYKAGSWPHIKIKVWYTGKTPVRSAPWPDDRFVFKRDGSLRPVMKSETLEFQRVYLKRK